MRVCYFGTYRASYSRNQIMIAGLRRNGVEVLECHVPLWWGIEDRVHTASGGWRNPAFIWRIVKTYYKLLQVYRQIDDYDVMVLGYPGQIDTFLARLLTWMRKKPLVLDVFMSITLIAQERGLTTKHPITGKLIYLLERTALRLPNMLIQDTGSYVAWLCDFFGLKKERFRLVPTGADNRVFQPMEQARTSGPFKVLYYGTFIPNHGVKYMIEAARLLREQEIYFEFLGDGPERTEAEALAAGYRLSKVKFCGWVDKSELPTRIAQADVCLGAFGTTPQSTMTVQNKIYEALAMAKPLITGDSATVREMLQDEVHLLLCRREDPQSLASAIARLKTDSDLRDRLARLGYERYITMFSIEALGALFLSHLETVVSSPEYN